MRCAACETELDAFTGDVCPHCQHFAHPTRLGIYDDLELIKRGGMGCVYRARHPELGTVVAIKTVQTHIGPETVADRFRREARLAARIPHPGIVRVLDHDSQEGRLYLVMEHVAGTTLRPPIEADDKDLAWKLDKVSQLADVLKTAHEHGIVHRDIKPENVMIDTTGRVRVLDFGIATILEEGDRLTQTGEILGTPEYIAPEQILDVPEAVDARTDVYAVGVVLYELLTGESPFAGGNLFQVLKNVESREPPPPSRQRPGIPDELDALVMRCIAKDPDHRPAHAGELLAMLRACTPAPSPPPAAVTSSRWGWASVGMGLALVLGFVGGRNSGTSRPPKALPPRAPSPATKIQELLAEPGPPDRAALAESRARLQGPEPEAAYWRGRSDRATGALLAAESEFAKARDAGFERAGIDAATMAVYRRRLLVPLLPGGDALTTPFAISLTGDDPLTRGLSALAAGNDAEALGHLRKVPNPSIDAALLGLLAASRSPGESLDSASIAAVAPRHDLVAALLRAQIAPNAAARASILEAALRSIDRRAPTRYLLELIAAAIREDDPRLRASLELSFVVGDSSLPLTCYAAYLLHRYPDLSGPQRARLRQVLAEIPAEDAALLRRKLQAKEQKHGK